MVKVIFAPSFKKKFSKIKDKALKEKIRKQFPKIRDNPEIGKPMKFRRKGTRELYVSPFRLSYDFSQEEEEVTFLDLYHKDEQ